MDLETGETIVWKGRPAYHIRYPVLTLVFFFGIFVLNLGPVGRAVGVISFFLWILFLIVSIFSLLGRERTRYFLTNRRIVAHKTSLLVPDLSGVRVEQSRLGKAWGTGNVYFDSTDGKWIVFKHVKDAQEIKQSVLNIKGTAIANATLQVCKYCGAQVPVGINKCPTCGADLS